MVVGIILIVVIVFLFIRAGIVESNTSSGKIKACQSQLVLNTNCYDSTNKWNACGKVKQESYSACTSTAIPTVGCSPLASGEAYCGPNPVESN